MKTVFLIVLSFAFGVVGAWWFKEREVRALGEQIAELQKRPASCAPSGLAGLGDALALLRQARPAPAVPARPLPPPIKVLPEEHSSMKVTIEDEDEDEDGRRVVSRDGGVNLMAVAGKLNDKSAAALQHMKDQVSLTGDQEQVLKADVDDMNTRIGVALDKLLSLPEHPRSRDFAPIAIDVLSTIKDADETFRAALTADQRTALDRDNFDIASQLDPLLLLHFLKNKDAH